MTVWDDDVFDRHPVWGQVDTLARLLEDENLPQKMEFEQHASIARLKAALELLREHQQKGLKVFYTKSMLDNVEAQLAQTVNPLLSTFLGDPGNYASSLNEAAVAVESVFSYAAQWPALPAGGQANAAGRAFGEYKREAEAAFEALQETNKELETRLEQLKTQLTAVETQMATVEERYTTSLESRETEYVEAVKRVEVSGEEAYDKAIRDDLEERKHKLEDLRGQARKLVAETRAQRDAAKALADSSRDSADWLAQRAVATDFGQQARRKSAAAWLYDVLGAAVIGTPLYFVLRHFLDSQGSDGTVAVSLTRISIIFGAVILGGYLFSRGATNHRQARASKSADIRLRTLEAFISKLEPEQQDQIRKGMAENIYLRGRLADDEEDSPNPFVGLIDRIAAGERDDKKTEPVP